jgi:thiol-disulfide isomerase/thioredoxin
MRHIWIAAAVAVAAVSPAVAAPKVGEAAPNFTITTFDKKKVTLAELRGKVVVINHWATWCGPCKSEMPMMSSFHARYKQNGFEIFGVTTEDSVQPSALKKVAAVLSYPLARGIKGNYPILKGVPTTYVIDRAGVLRLARAGSFEAQEFIDLILPLLREPAPE